MGIFPVLQNRISVNSTVAKVETTIPLNKIVSEFWNIFSAMLKNAEALKGIIMHNLAIPIHFSECVKQWN